MQNLYVLICKEDLPPHPGHIETAVIGHVRTNDPGALNKALRELIEGSRYLGFEGGPPPADFEDRAPWYRERLQARGFVFEHVEQIIVNRR